MAGATAVCLGEVVLIETGEAERTVTLKVDRWWTGGDETELVVAASMSVAS
ncbi:MAG: hypothetical protein ACKODX_23130 [Gemmata sp.]